MTQNDQLSLEHVIPDVLGGRLTCAFLCRICNSQLGYTLDCQVKNDPSVMMAVNALRPEVPKIAKKYFEGQIFDVRGDGPQSKAVYKRGKLKPKVEKLADGSLIKATPNAREQLKVCLREGGYSTEQEEQELKKFDEAPENQLIDYLPTGLKMVKWAVHEFEPNYEGKLVDTLFLLKIAYEYTALALGGAIFDSGFDGLRTALRTCSSYDGFRFEQGIVPPYKPCHGIVITSQFPYVVQIMLFGELRFKLTFPRVDYGGKCVSYYHNLASGQEDWECLYLPDET